MHLPNIVMEHTGKLSIKQTNKKEVGVLLILYGFFSYQINMY